MVTMRTEHITGTNWQARMSEANDGIGAARDALRGTWGSERRKIEKELAFWLQQKAHIETWLRSEEAYHAEWADDITAVGLDA